MDSPNHKKLTSFRKLPKATDPAKPSVPAQLSVPGFMKAGTVLTDIEKEGLKQLGIVEDAAKIPSNIAEKVSAVMAESAPAIAVPNQPLKLPTPVDFKDLPEDKKKEISDFIKSAATAPSNFKETAPSFNNMANPDVFRQPEIIDDIAEAEEPEKKEYKQPEPVASTDSGLFNKDVIVKCPHCGWDASKGELTEVTEQDKTDFVQSIIGGIRFKKVYSLYGGRLKITFRTLTTAESDMAYKQLLVDAQNDLQSKILGDTSFYWRTLMAYRAVIAVEKVESSDNIIEIPPIDEIEVDADSYSRPNTKLYALFDDLVSQIMPSEMLRNSISHIYTEFQALVEKMQAMAESKDFW